MVDEKKVISVRLLNIVSINKEIDNYFTIFFYVCLDISYCGIALRYVDDNYKLFTFILGCFPYDADNHSAPHLREFIIKKLEEFKLKLDLSKYVVSDNEPKMLATFPDYCIHVGCADHYLNKQLQHAFESEQLHANKNVVEKVDCDIVQNMFNQIKKVVCHIRRSHQQQTLSKKVVSYSDTRFNGTLMMMDNFAELFFELPSALVNSNFMMNYNLIENDLLDCVCNFHESFEEMIVNLSEEQRPTLHEMIPLRQTLINSCVVEANDSNGIIQLKVFLDEEI